MSKFLLDPEPTFKAAVQIPVHGGKVSDVEFTFKHRTESDFAAYFADVSENQPAGADVIMGIVTCWSIDAEFTRENVEKLLQNYMGAGVAIIDKYAAEITGNRLGN